MSEVIIIRPEEADAKRKNEQGYDYTKRELVKRGTGKLVVNHYTIAPCASAYPYHYHTQNEEVFYILSGEGILRTADGEKIVRPGDLLYFPANEGGAHKLTNTSETETLVYLDIDTSNVIDVSVYPDSGKIGIWGGGINKTYKLEDAVDYYEGE